MIIMLAPGIFQGFAILYVLVGAYAQQQNPHFFKKQTQAPSLVVGSVRDKQSDETTFAKDIWEEKNANLSYCDRNDIITMDVKAAGNTGRHIIGDAATYIFIPPMHLRNIYLERPDTFPPTAPFKPTHNCVKAYQYHYTARFRGMLMVCLFK
jgi:hypothetical protein